MKVEREIDIILLVGHEELCSHFIFEVNESLGMHSTIHDLKLNIFIV